MEFVEVDGSEGEGGGQILRSAVAFSAIQHRPVRVTQIRAGRGVPGLKRQHLAALRILATVFEAELTGAAEGSSEITFAPGDRRRGNLSIGMGTAASITLVLQAVVPAVALTGSSLRLDLEGGTDVPWSPTLDYFGRVVREAYRSMGIVFEVTAQRRGYYPRGGGRVSALIEPCASIIPLGPDAGKAASEAAVVSRCGSLPRHVADRQLSSASEALVRAGYAPNGTETTVESSDSPGSSVLVYHCTPGAFLGADAIGSRGRPAEEVGRDAATRFVKDAGSGAMVDANLGDMIIPLLSLASGPSEVSVPSVTPHLESGLHLAEKFTGCRWSVRRTERRFQVRVDPTGRG